MLVFWGCGAEKADNDGIFVMTAGGVCYRAFFVSSLSIISSRKCRYFWVVVRLL